jgi:hypothetical protein
MLGRRLFPDLGRASRYRMTRLGCGTITTASMTGSIDNNFVPTLVFRRNSYTVVWMDGQLVVGKGPDEIRLMSFD